MFGLTLLWYSQSCSHTFKYYISHFEPDLSFFVSFHFLMQEVEKFNEGYGITEPIVRLCENCGLTGHERSNCPKLKVYMFSRYNVCYYVKVKILFWVTIPNQLKFYWKKNAHYDRYNYCEF